MSETNATLPGEEWRDVVGQEGRYQVSNLGRVKSLARVNQCWNGVSWCQIPVRERILKPTPIKKSKHLMVSIRADGRQRGFYVHRLVLEAFVGPCPPGLEARHFPDRSPSNNRLDNLSWATHEVNMGDRDAQGTSLKGRKLSPEHRAKLRAKKRSDEFKAKVSAGLRRAYAEGRRRVRVPHATGAA